MRLLYFYYIYISISSDIQSIENTLSEEDSIIKNTISNIANAELIDVTEFLTFEPGSIGNSNNDVNSASYTSMYLRTPKDKPIYTYGYNTLIIKNNNEEAIRAYVYGVSGKDADSINKLASLVGINSGSTLEVKLNSTKYIRIILRRYAQEYYTDAEELNNIDVKFKYSLNNIVTSITNTINMQYNEVSLMSSFVQGTISIKTGVEANNSHYIRTSDYIDISELDNSDTINIHYDLTHDTDNPDGRNVNVYMFRYDENYNYIDYIRHSINNGSDIQYNINNAKKIKLAVMYYYTADEGAFTISPTNFNNYDILTIRYYNKIINEIKSNNNTNDNRIAINNLFSVYKRFAVIGDSLSSGRVYTLDGYSSGIDIKSISWPYYIIKQFGNTVFNCSIHGQSPDTFIKGYLYDDRPTTTGCGYNQISYLLDGNHDVPLIIIALGVNNHNSISVGNIDDIDLSDYNNNGLTKYGWFGKMLQMLAEYYNNKQKKVEILLTLPYIMATGSQGTTISALINNVLNKVQEPLEANGYVKFHTLNFSRYKNIFDNTDIFNLGVSHNHYVSVTYNAVATMYGLALNDWIAENIEELMDIEALDTNVPIEDNEYLDKSQFM